MKFKTLVDWLAKIRHKDFGIYYQLIQMDLTELADLYEKIQDELLENDIQELKNRLDNPAPN